MFTIQVDTKRTLDGNVSYTAFTHIGCIVGRALDETDDHAEVSSFIEEHIKYLAERGIRSVKIVDNIYNASSTPDVTEHIWYIGPKKIKSKRDVRVGSILRDLNGELHTVLRFEGGVFIVTTYGRGETYLVETHLRSEELVRY